jgi:hypothetical protein
MKSQILGNGADHSGSSSERFSFNKILQTQETISVGMQVYNLTLKKKTEHKFNVHGSKLKSETT